MTEGEAAEQKTSTTTTTTTTTTTSGRELSVETPPVNVCHASDLPTSPDSDKQKFKVYKIVLTGGPCGGKTTAQVRLATFFENIGWKVFTVPETATILLGGRVKFSELDDFQSYLFQRDLLATMHQIETTFFNQAHSIKNKNVLVICDRGCMDPAAYSHPDHWKKMLSELGYDEFELRCNRYDQIAHLVTAADGAEKYYTLGNNITRSEGITHARNLDNTTRNVWVGHPYLDIIDNANTASFEDKVNKLIQVVCDRTGIRSGDRLDKNSNMWCSSRDDAEDGDDDGYDEGDAVEASVRQRVNSRRDERTSWLLQHQQQLKKRKWLVSGIDESMFVPYEQFEMEHCYLLTDNPKYQVRLRRRTQRGRSSYTLTAREWFAEEHGSIETRMQLNEREYMHYQAMKDKSRVKLFKLRRCFMVGTQYFNLDIYKDPQPPKADGNQYVFLETYTTSPKGAALPQLPHFLTIVKEITGDEKYSMYTLSKLPDVPCPNEFLGSAVYKDD